MHINNYNFIKLRWDDLRVKTIYDLMIHCITINENDIICLGWLGNPRFYDIACKFHKKELIYIIEDCEIKFFYDSRTDIDKDHIKFVDSNKLKIEDFKFNGIYMKFDKIIMNPPYSKNLHLKILAKVITMLKDENSACVNLSPIRWLQDPLAKYKQNSDLKRFEDSIIKHIENIDEVSASRAQQLFSNVMNFNLGIYKCSKKNFNFNPNSMINQIILKSMNKLKSTPIIEKNKKNGWRVRIPLITGGESGGSGKRKIGLRTFGKLLYFYDGIKDGKPWYEHYMKNQYSKTTPEITASIKFNSENESKNFINSFLTNFGKYYTHNVLKDVHVFEKSFLWMGDCINPRTGLRGYESEWTDEDFYKFFDITEEEQKLIAETMEKYK